LSECQIPQSKQKLGWRLVDPSQGEVNALPNTRGTMIATDGVMCIIRTEDDRVLLGHFDWFNKDKKESEQSSTAKRKTKPQILEEFIV